MHEHRTTSIWHSATLICSGFEPVHVENDGDFTELTFQDSGDELERIVSEIQQGIIRVNAMAYQQAYYKVRGLIRKTGGFNVRGQSEDWGRRH